jgi:hypothetical protein
MGASARRAGKRIGCVAVIAAAAVTAGLSVHHDLTFVSQDLTPKSVASQTAALHQEECLYQAIRLMVPKDATVYVNANRWNAAQRLSELSTAWAVPDANLASARYRLTLVSARGHPLISFPIANPSTPLVPAHGLCDGVNLEVRRL